VSYDEFRRTRYFRALDGLRAVSILLVVAFHTDTGTFGMLNGRLGVSIFFVISGFLITTLCLREEAERDRVSLARFYMRRACRILPLYYIALAVYIGVYVVLNFHGRRQSLVDMLPWYLAYMNDFGPHIFDGSTPFQLSWSLGVEEKFYLLWPVLAFVVLRVRRLELALALAVAPVALLPFGFGWTVYYAEIMAGCALAIALHDERSYRFLAVLSRPPVAVLVLAGFFLTHHFVVGNRYWLLLYPFVVAAAMVPLVTARPIWGRLLASRPMVFVGERAYAIYLFHILCLLTVISVLKRAGVGFDANDHALAHRPVVGGLVFVVGAAGSLVIAEFLRRTVELRCIAFGRRWAGRRQAPETTPALSAT
jgi:peptidoglycan/LPS O-acetylase OafA/YrhL